MTKSKILIADDAELNREILTQMLGDQYDFIYACDGVEAIDILNSNGEDIDLLLLDVNMPNKDGFDVLRTMNEQHWIESIPVIIISAETHADFITKAYQLGVTDYISRPFHTIVVQQRVENTLLMYSNQKKLVQLVEKQVYEREKINNSMINIFSDIIETRNHESGTHTLNVQTITNLLLNALNEKTDKYNLTKSDISLYSTLSALHDIGKIKVPESVLNKPGKLDADEWEVMKAHTIYGDEILSNPELDQNSKFVCVARSICRWHHEKWDGKGYPDGLAGDDIPIAAQVVSMADVYDALTSERCYKPAFTHEQAIKMITEGECGVFNPLLLESLNDVSEMLKNLKQAGVHYDFQYDAISVADELLAEDHLPQQNLLNKMLHIEQLKKTFFIDCLDGIQFEFDKLQDKVTYVNKVNANEVKRKVLFTSRENDNNFLPVKYWDVLRDMLLKSGRDNPVVETEVMLRCDENREVEIPYKAKVMALWPEDSDEYVAVVGHFVPVGTDN